MKTFLMSGFRTHWISAIIVGSFVAAALKFISMNTGAFTLGVKELIFTMAYSAVGGTIADIDHRLSIPSSIFMGILYILLTTFYLEYVLKILTSNLDTKISVIAVSVSLILINFLTLSTFKLFQSAFKHKALHLPLYAIVLLLSACILFYIQLQTKLEIVSYILLGYSISLLSAYITHIAVDRFH